MALGAPARYDEPYPSVGDLLMYLRSLKFNGTGERKALVFGSMGANGGATETMKELLTEAGFSVVDECEIYYIPDGDELEACLRGHKKTC